MPKKQLTRNDLTFIGHFSTKKHMRIKPKRNEKMIVPYSYFLFSLHIHEIISYSTISGTGGWDS